MLQTLRNRAAGIIICAFIFTPRSLSAEGGFIYDAQGRRDPFIPLVTSDGRLLKLDAKETKGQLTIEGIIYDEKGISYAIVNNVIVKIGDNIEGYQVLKIEADRISFIKEGNVSELKLLKEAE